MKQLDIISCLRDKRLLGHFIDDESTFVAWFTFLRAFFGLKPELGDKQRFKAHTGRSKWPSKAANECWVPVGVRGGKSFTIAILALFFTLFQKHKLSLGERGYVLIVAPTRKQATIIKNYCSGFLAAHPLFKGHIVRETAEEIELDNNTVIATLSSDYKSLRGFTAIACIIDEIGYLNFEGAKPDVEVVRALRSRLLTTGGPLICIGSPYAKRGELWETFKKHYGQYSPVLVWQAPSRAMNPTLKESVIARALAEDPEAAKADYLAEFRSDIASFISREVVEACVANGRYELPPITDVKYFAFVDPAGGSGQDSMTLAIAHKEGPLMVLDALRDVRPPFSPEMVTAEFAELLKRFNIREVTGDRFGGEWPRERFKVHGIRYELAPKNKSDLYQAALPMLNSGEVQLLDNTRLINQLWNLERRTARGGRDSIDHPPNAHDDLANVCCGVLVCGLAWRRRSLVWGRDDELSPNFSTRRRLDITKMFPGANSIDDLRMSDVD